MSGRSGHEGSVGEERPGGAVAGKAAVLPGLSSSPSGGSSHPCRGLLCTENCLDRIGDCVASSPPARLAANSSGNAGRSPERGVVPLQKEAGIQVLPVCVPAWSMPGIPSAFLLLHVAPFPILPLVRSIRSYTDLTLFHCPAGWPGRGAGFALIGCSGFRTERRGESGKGGVPLQRVPCRLTVPGTGLWPSVVRGRQCQSGVTDAAEQMIRSTVSGLQRCPGEGDAGPAWHSGRMPGSWVSEQAGAGGFISC